MKRYKVGYFKLESQEEYYTYDFSQFFKQMDTMLIQEDLEAWAIWLNSPWSQAHEEYVISVNCESAYAIIDADEPVWKCEYHITGYDGIEAGIIGYGNTEIDSLNECILHFKELQKKYNPDDESY